MPSAVIRLLCLVRVEILFYGGTRQKLRLNLNLKKNMTIQLQASHLNFFRFIDKNTYTEDIIEKK
jgi:hypothetical protein